MEEWKDIEGYEGLYKVSNLGRIYSTISGKVLKKSLHKTGYRVVSLHKDMKTVVCYVHRLVANAFLPKEEGYYEINHKDEDKSNNAVDNLEWCDRQYNVAYGTGRKRAGESIGKPVVLENALLFHSVREASRFTGVDASNILRCCNGQLKTAGKHPDNGTPLHWQFYEDYLKNRNCINN